MLREISIQKIITVLSVITLVTVILSSCENDKGLEEIDVPHVITNKVYLNNICEIVSSGKIIIENSEAIIEKGVCWSLQSNPTINNERSMHGTGEGLFTSKISGLKTNSTYYFRAYAVTNKGVFYGNEEIFLTDYYEYRGKVIDFISKQAVKDAKIYLGAVPFCEDYIRLWTLPEYALTDEQGNFAYRIKKSIWPYDFKCTYIYAQTSSHVGSDVPGVPKGDLTLNSPIQMYHPSTARIRVVNDTISNDIDSAEFGLVYEEIPYLARLYPGFIGNSDMSFRPLYRVKLAGRDLDTTIVINNLWGSAKYEARVVDLSNPFSEYNKINFTAPSDSTVEYEIRF